MPSKKIFTPEDVDQLESDTEYRNCTFDELSLKRCDLQSSTFTHCTLQNCNLTNARLNASTFRACNFTGAVVAGCNFFSAVFEDCKLLGLNFSRGTKVTAARFIRCNLDFADLSGLDLSKMDFGGSTLVEANLAHAKLEETSFRGCNLAHARFEESRFGDTDLRGANLTGLDLRRHNLRGIIISPGQFEYLAGELGITILE